MKEYIKMEKTIIKFGDVEIEKQRFQQHKRLISIKTKDINKILVSNKASGEKGFKYFNGYKDAETLDLYAYFIQK